MQSKSKLSHFLHSQLLGNNKKQILLLLFIVGVFITGLEFVNTGPYVISSTPRDGEEHVNMYISSIAADNLFVPEETGFKGGVDNSTISNATVKLVKVIGDTVVDVPGTVQGTGGGDAISFSPASALEPNTQYKFTITNGVKSHKGEPFLPYESVFKTGTINTIPPSKPLPVEFTKVAVPGTQDKYYTSLVFGPDDNFYALRLDGVIERYTVNHETGMLVNRKLITTLKDAHGTRTAIGLAFDPASTPQNLIAWVSHSSSGLSEAPSFDGNISRLSGANLEQEQLAITKLPRSNKDHLVNSLVFGPDGALYFSQGSNSSMGDYDGFWQRSESLLSAAILRLDLKKLNKVKLPLDVQTTKDQKLINNAPAASMRMADGTYNPYSSESPLTIYASGVRNAYDLVWHSNGQLYAPSNGSAAGGNTPASVKGTRRADGTFYDGPDVEATSAIQLLQYKGRVRKFMKLFVDESEAAVQNDWLFRINPLKPIGYFGHPNPLRGEYVANRGAIDVPKYPEGTIPDKNYRYAAFDFGLHKSPNGALEYKSDAFGGVLKGRILVCRFAGGSDVIVLEPGAMIRNPEVTSAESDDSCYDIVRSVTGSGQNGIPGLSGFANPLDIVEDVKTGNLYVSEFNRNNSKSSTAQITLLRVKEQKQTPSVIASSIKQ